MTPPANTERYKHHRFPGEIIRHGVWLYYRFTLSYRDVQELPAACHSAPGMTGASAVLRAAGRAYGQPPGAG